MLVTVTEKHHMNSLASLILPAFVGLMAGIGHGIISHKADLPLSLTDQFLQILLPSQGLED